MNSGILAETGEATVQFFMACIVLGLQYLHSKGIVYRDLKPENILLFEDGYPRLADFGLAKKLKPEEKAYEIRGTILYVSPEMMKNKGYDHGNDLWGLGILLYELLFRRSPFPASIVKSRNFEKHVTDFAYRPQPQECSKEGFDLIKRLLVLNPAERIGYHNMEEIKKHPFFSEIDWQKLEKKELFSPVRETIETLAATSSRKT